MKVKIYQMRTGRPTSRYLFCDYNAMQNGLGMIPFEDYDLVFDGVVHVQTLEKLFVRFNADDRPNGTTMRSMSVSDIVEIVEADPALYSPGFYFCDTIGFRKLSPEEFVGVPSRTENIVPDIARVLYRRYQLDWMRAAGKTLSDLFAELQNILSETEDEDINLEAAFEEVGFGGSIWVCFDEFMDDEFRDASYMLSLCENTREKEAYLATIKTEEN